MTDIISQTMLYSTMAENNTQAAEIALLKKTVEKLEKLYDAEREAHMRTIASRAGFKELSGEIIGELENPHGPRYLSDPKNRDARQKFFEQKRDEAYREVKAKNG